jgi:hypothetical protein
LYLGSDTVLTEVSGDKLKVRREMEMKIKMERGLVKMERD